VTDELEYRRTASRPGAGGGEACALRDFG
jgi:hypothetical protein